MSIDEIFATIPQESLPKHVALIPNGHRTWADKVGKSPMEAHKIGMENILEILRSLQSSGIHTFSVWVMSTENFVKRSKEEIGWLEGFLVMAFERWAKELHESGSRLVHIGRKDRMPEKISRLFEEWEEKTKNNAKHLVNICFDYGGHDEVLRGVEKFVSLLKDGKAKIEDLREEVGMFNGKYPIYGFANYLDTANQPHPYPDLIIRTNSEQRLSGFMPWQSVYSEFYPAPELMPEVKSEIIKKAIIEFTKRRRTFGGN